VSHPPLVPSAALALAASTLALALPSAPATAATTAATTASAAAAATTGQPADAPSLAEYFGFMPLEVVRIGNGAGPLVVADVDGDGLNDVVVANDRESRIEVHRQRPGAVPGDARPASRVNEFPEHWRFERRSVPVRHAIGSMTVRDFDGDGRQDIVYTGQPAEIVFLRQLESGGFESTRRHRKPGLSMSRSGLVVADVIGDAAPELLAIVRGEIHVHPLEGFDIGTPRVLAAGSPIVAMRVADFDGDGRNDVTGLLADDPAPVRLWLGGSDETGGILGGQQRFEMPPLSDARPIRLPGRSSDVMGVVETRTRRVVLQELVTEAIETGGDRDAAYVVRSYTDPGNRQRSATVFDLDGDGRLDLLATDREANALASYRQVPGKGLSAGERHPTLTDITRIVAGNVDDDPQAEIFVLSEGEKLIGRVDVAMDGDGIDLPFPKPLSLPAAVTPVAMGLGVFDGDSRLIVVGEDRRDYRVDLLGMDGSVITVELGKLSRAPETVLAADVDQDGRTDVLLLTGGRDPILLLAETAASATATEADATSTGAASFRVVTSDDMGQAGLINAAGPVNTTILDVDGDGSAELLIADANFVRAVRYDEQPGAGISPGWQVVLQVNARDTGARLSGLAVLGDRVVAADGETDALLVMESVDGDWQQTESLTVRGFGLGPVSAGAFSGDGEPNVLSLGNDGFAVVRFGGERRAFHEIASWQPDDERRRPHELGIGDINGDGYIDIVSLDSAEQQCDILTMDGAEQLQFALGFTVFESRMFSGGSTREYEPSQAIIADVTGDGADDLVLLCHDRVLVYPQMTAADAG
jgi:hypothetical protein